MVQTNKLLTFLAIAGFLVLALSSIALAQPKPITQKAEYAVTHQGTSYTVSVWLNKDVIAYSSQGSTSSIALWQMWKSKHPSFFQVYPDVSYRVEFNRLANHSMTEELDGLRRLVENGEFIDKGMIGGKQFELSSLESGEAVDEEVSQWQEYKTFDYADIGDNEADPVLGKLIRQGFVRPLVFL